MQCDNCGENEAVIHLTQIVNNEMSTFHLCEGCASEKGLEPGVPGGELPLTDVLAQMGKGASAEAQALVCSYCGLTLEGFKRSGRLGCPHCYVAFESHLRGLLRRLHRGTQHVGKVYRPPDPTEVQRLDRLQVLRRRLERAVAAEDFESAARLRDEIRDLEAVLG